MNVKNDKKIRAAIVLSGCGVYDGSEIHEAVIALLCLLRRGTEVEFFAPDVQQSDCINHLDVSNSGSPRNVLAESARIARGKIESLSLFDADNFDMLVFPGGFGAAKNLSTFAYDGADCVVEPSVEKAIKSMLVQNKKLVFMCISPVIAAKVIGDGVKLTIGNDKQTSKALEACGAKHIDCGAETFVEDKLKNVYSTPAYMLATNAAQVERAAEAMFAEIFETL